MKVLRLSKHFIRQWALRKGSLPSIEEVNEIINDSLLIMKQQLLYRRMNDGVMAKHQELSHYWCHAAAVILIVDDREGRAVTLLTPDMESKFDDGSRRADVGCRVSDVRCRKIDGKGKGNGDRTGTADAARIIDLLRA
jgi:hypothetical protein